MSLDGFARPLERPFLRRIEDWVEEVSSSWQWQLTDFLTPREQYLATSLARHHSLVVATDGGYQGAERARMLIMPGDWQPDFQDFRIAFLAVTSVSGGRLTHGSVLGSILGTGIDRRKVGDIHVTESAVVVMVCAEMVKYVESSVSSVGREPVLVRELPLRPEIAPQADERKTISVASLRLDAVVAQACHFSRGDAQTLIKRGHVKLNFLEQESVDESVQTGDTISVRGFGRVNVYDVLGQSRKDRLRIEVGVIRSS